MKVIGLTSGGSILAELFAGEVRALASFAKGLSNGTALFATARNPVAERVEKIVMTMPNGPLSMHDKAVSAKTHTPSCVVWKAGCLCDFCGKPTTGAMYCSDICEKRATKPYTTSVAARKARRSTAEWNITTDFGRKFRRNAAAKK